MSVPVSWEDSPSTATPLTAETLNQMQAYFTTARDAAVSAKEAAEAAAATATAPTDTTVATFVGSSSSTQAALDARYRTHANAKVHGGATGDGVTDDGAALAATITAAGTFGVRTVYLPPGTYLTSQKITVPTGTTVVGVPGRTIVKAAAGSTASPLLFAVTGASDVLVSGVTFDGNQSGVTSYNNVCVVYQSTRVRFDQCRWQNTRGIGVIFSTDVSYSGVTGSSFSEVGSYNKVSGLNADRRQAVAYSSGTKANNKGNFVTGCTFTEVGLDCVSMSAQAEGLIAHNRVYGNYAGALYVSGSSQVKIIGNHIEGGDTSGNGVDVFSSDTVSVVGNTAKGRGGAGIMLADVANATVLGNVCLNNFRSNGTGSPSSHQGGITLYGSASACSNVVISANVCTDTQGTKTQAYGVQVSAHAHTNIRIDESNRLTGNLTAEIGGGGEFSPFARTPTFTNFTINDATVKVRYSATRERVTEQGSITIGATPGFTGSGVFIGLPVTPHADILTNGIVGSFAAFDTSASTYKTGVILRSGTQGRLIFHDSTAPTSTVPWTWATGDVLTWNLSYTPAAL